MKDSLFVPHWVIGEVRGVVQLVQALRIPIKCIDSSEEIPWLLVRDVVLLSLSNKFLRDAPEI